MISVHSWPLAVMRGMAFGASVALVPTIVAGLVFVIRHGRNVGWLYCFLRPGGLIDWCLWGDASRSKFSHVADPVIMALLANGAFGAFVGAAGTWMAYVRPYQFRLKSFFRAVAACAAALATSHWSWVYVWALARQCAAWWATLAALIALVLALDSRIRAARLKRSTLR